jgi:predicted nucleic acid-binding protein
VEHRPLKENLKLESLSRRLHIAAYDVAYLDFAQRHNLPLATSDGALRAAAVEEGIALI